MSDPTVLTIILNYKTADMTLQSVAAARAAMAGIPGEIIVVDNDSQDGSYEAISAHIETENWAEGVPTRAVQSGRNGGFGAGNNVGIQAGLSDGSRPDFYYVLNSDAFPASDAIRKLYDHLRATPTCGFAGSYIHGPEGDTHLTSFRFPSVASEFEGAIRFGPVSRLLRRWKVPVETPGKTTSLDWLAGASMMMRGTPLEQIGLFDESFFLYFEETDLCQRIHKAGFTVDYVRASEVAHIGSVSTGMKNWARVPGYWFDSRWHYFCKNHGTFYAALATTAHLTGGFLHWLRCLVTGKRHDIPPGFLTTMLAHDLKALVSPAAKRPASYITSPQIGE
jgi:GT2 family glycosyltransferase